MAADVTLVKGSKEYLYADLTADVVLDNQPVEFGIAANVDAVTAWMQGAWMGDPGETRSARVLLDGSLAVGQYGVWVRITDTPEIPIVALGKLKIVR